MTRYILNIFLPIRSVKRLIPILGVMTVLSIGIGIFWAIQSLLGNYLDGLVDMATTTKEEIAIMKNPDRKFMTEEELDDEFFSGKKKSIAERLAIPASLYQELVEKIHSFDERFLVQGMNKIPEADFVQEQENGQVFHFKPVLIAANIQPDCRILPIFDTLTEKEIQEFNTQGDTLPVLTSEGVFPDLKTGDTIRLKWKEKECTLRLIGTLKQSELFAIPTVVMSIDSYTQMAGPESFNFIAVRTPYKNSADIVPKLESLLGQQYIISHWSEILKVLSSVFNSINVIITAIISSLFVIAFIFSAATFDIIIRKRKQHLALFLAMGMPPAQIRRCLMYVSGGIGLAGLLIGALFAKIFLLLIPLTPLKSMFEVMYIQDFSFRCSGWSFIMAILMTFTATLFSAWIASRRVYRIDPLEDLKK